MLAASCWTACSSRTPVRLLPDLTGSEKPFLAVTDSALTTAALQFLVISKEDQPEEYSRRQAVFNSLLADYLAQNNAAMPSALQVERNGQTFVFPLQVLQMGSIDSGKNAARAEAQALKPIGPAFAGEVLDLAKVTLMGEDKESLLLLFADSLLALRWPEPSAASARKLLFHPLDLAETHYARGRGVIDYSPGKPSAHPVLITTSLRGPLIVGQDKGGLRALRPGRQESNPASPFAWQQTAPASTFQSAELGPFLSLRPLENSEHFALLDGGGYLKLFRRGTQQPVWQSRRAWGSRMFLLNERTLAVCDDIASSFVGFSSRDDTLQPRGQSPELPGRVTAMTGVTAEKQEGFLLALASPNAAGKTKTQLYFLPNKSLRWQNDAEFEQPVIRDDAGSLAVALPEELPAQISPATLPPTATNLLYEAPYWLTSAGMPEPVLTQGATSDATGRVWELHFCSNIKFADGSEVTTKEIVEGWQRTWRRCVRERCPQRWLWQIIEGSDDLATGVSGIEIQGPLALRLRLKEPRPNFLHHLTQACFSVTKESATAPLGTGPYFVARRQGNMLVCTGNPWFRRGQPALREIRLNLAVPEAIDFLSLGSAHAALMRTKEVLDYVGRMSDLVKRPFPAQTLYYAAVNPTMQPLTDSDLRKHILVNVIQREVIAGILTQAEATVTPALFSGSNHSVMFAPREFRYNGRALLVSYKASDSVAGQIASRVVARLNQLGISGRLQKMTETAYATLLENRGYDILVDAVTPVFNDPLYDLQHLLASGIVIENKVLDQISGGMKSPGTYRPEHIEELIAQDAVLLPIVRTQAYAALPARLYDWRLSGSSVLDLADAWVPQPVPRTRAEQ